VTDPAAAREASARATARHSMGLLAVLGVVFGLSVTVGNTIGSGILRTPGLVAQLLPTPWLFIGVWILGALYAALGANALADDAGVRWLYGLSPAVDGQVRRFCHRLERLALDV